MATDSNPTGLDNWVSTGKLLELYPEFTETTIAYLMREREQLGLDDAVRVIGRTRYISIPRLAEWLENGCRRARPGGPQKRYSDLQSDGQPSKRKGLQGAGHTASTKRGITDKN